ncbi:PDZ domain-containing protein [Clostridium tetani]|nr:PDZ domain-containing protein [Clostridium tetani]
MNILMYTLRSIAYMLTDMYSLLLLLLLGVILYTKNIKIIAMQKTVLGDEVNSPFELTISQIVMGIFGGVVASIIMAYLGVIFYETSGIYILFLISILLMSWKPRMICFSYSAAILGILSILNYYIASFMGVEKIKFLDVDIPSMIALVAALHIVEGLLIMVDGSRGAIPIFSKKEEHIIGGFALRRLWPLPIAFFVLLNSTDILNGGNVSPMPNWWPILNTSIPEKMLMNSVVALVSFYGVLGYSSITFTKSKEKKALSSGAFIVAYGIIMLLIAQISGRNTFIKIISIISMPIIHETMLIIQQYMEVKRDPKYISDGEGIMVLDVAPNSLAENMGIESGDLLLEINNENIKSELDIKEVINRKIIDRIKIKVKKDNGNIKELLHENVYEVNRLGAILIPKAIKKDEHILESAGRSFAEILEKIKEKQDDFKDGDE